MEASPSLAQKILSLLPLFLCQNFSCQNSLFGSRSCSDRHLFVCILSESGFTRFFDSQDYCFTNRPHHPTLQSLNPDSDRDGCLNQDLPDSSILRITAHPHAVHYSEPHHPANPINLDSVYPTNPAEPHHPVNPLIPLILIQTSTSV